MFDSNNDGNIDIAEELNIRYQYTPWLNPALPAPKSQLNERNYQRQQRVWPTSWRKEIEIIHCCDPSEIVVIDVDVVFDNCSPGEIHWSRKGTLGVRPVQLSQSDRAVTKKRNVTSKTKMSSGQKKKCQAAITEILNGQKQKCQAAKTEMLNDQKQKW